jgi:hypothetical protein
MNCGRVGCLPCCPCDCRKRTAMLVSNLDLIANFERMKHAHAWTCNVLTPSFYQKQNHRSISPSLLGLIDNVNLPTDPRPPCPDYP